MGFALAAAKFEAGSLEAACRHELPNDPPTHSQSRPLKILVPILLTVLSTALVLLGSPLAPRLGTFGCLHVRLHLDCSWSSSAVAVPHLILFSVCAFFRSRCLK